MLVPQQTAIPRTPVHANACINQVLSCTPSSVFSSHLQHKCQKHNCTVAEITTACELATANTICTFWTIYECTHVCMQGMVEKGQCREEISSPDALQQ